METEPAVAKDDKEELKEEEKEEVAGSEDDQAAADNAGAGEGKKKLSKKMMIILGVIGFIVVMGGAGAGLYFAGILGGPKDPEAADIKQAAKSDKAVFYNLGDIIVNLSGEGRRPNYLKIKITLELANEKDIPTLDLLKPRIIDNFQVYLRELRIEDLRGSAGLYRLREELLLRVTEAVQPVRVRDVLFQEMLVQ